MPVAAIRPHHGAPALWVDGEPMFPLVMMTTPAGLRDLQALGYEGTHLYTVDPPPFWTAMGTYDFTGFDAHLREFVAADPQAMIIPRIAFDAPADWMDAHPDELIVFATPDAALDTSWGGARHASWASDVWQQDAFAALRALLAHTAAQPWGANIIGWHIGAGVYGEWHYFNAVHYPDRSAPFLRGYEAWLRARYPGQEIDATPPTVEERKKGDWAGVLDPSRRWGAIDYFTYFHQVGADLLGAFAHIVKETSDDTQLVVAFNGYLPDLGINHEVDQRGFDRVLRNPDVDVLSSPHTYWRRRPGEDAIPRAFPASVHLHGKMHWDEQDDRTILAPEQYQRNYLHVTDMAQSVEILWRGFAHALTLGQGLWYMDQGALWYGDDPANSYYRDPVIVRAFEQMRAIAANSMRRNRARKSEVAVISDLHAAFHYEDTDWTIEHVGTRLYHRQVGELARCGLPFDFYLMADLEAMPTYTACLFLDAIYLTDAQRDVIRRLREHGTQLGFLYAAGIASPAGLSLPRMEELLGMPLRFGNAPAPHPSLPPALLDAPDGVAVGDRTWYAPQPPLPAAVLRRLLRASGAHVYLECDDTLMVGGGYLAVHTATAGRKTLRLPAPATWTNLRTGEVVARNSAEYSVETVLGETLLFSVE